MFRDRDARLIAGLHAERRFDFTRFDPRDPDDQVRLVIAMTSYDWQIRMQVLQAEAQLLLQFAQICTDPAVKRKIAAQGVDRVLRWQAIVAPWRHEYKSTAETEQDQYNALNRAWREWFGDYNDPEVQARIQAQYERLIGQRKN